MTSGSAGSRRTAPDAAIRARVVDPRQSFIVQAPAGSGKTELLIQRMLRVLSVVEQPESVLAITFTRKAASEMRNRILQALSDSQNERARDLPPHKVELSRLAHRVAEHDANLGWKLLENPQRLQIRTVDSFCESVARHLPMLAGIGGQVEIAEDASRLYQAAAERTIALLADTTRHKESEAVATLLLYLDNNVAKLRSLLATMLAKRDQWLDKLGQSGTLTDSDLDDLRTRLQDALAQAVTDEIETARAELIDLLGPGNLGELLGYMRIAADLAAPESPSAHLRDILSLPDGHSDALKQWRALRLFCLTTGGTLRSRFNAKDGGITGPQATRCKDFFKDTLAALPGAERIQELIAYIGDKLPDPAYSESEWEFVRALLILLPVSVAHLLLVENERGKVDFVEMSMAAISALRTTEGPTELGLALGARIRHVLIDEFQDTSVSQVRLLKSLQGWEADDDCSVFAVGDPMQSIYAFREAEVANFTSAVRTRQVAEIAVDPERLTANFRSQGGLIDWFNSVFPTVFQCERSAHGDELIGAVHYSAAIASNPSLEGAAVTIHGFPAQDYLAEAECVARLAEQALAEKENNRVAVLVRARPHLRHIIEALNRRAVPYRAVKIDALGTRQIVLDLDALVRAIVNLADRTAWLAILRAPWCGLTLEDLWTLCRNDQRSTIVDLLRARMSLMTADGQGRASRLLAVLETALADSGRIPLSLRVERAWIQLGGPASLSIRDRKPAVANAQVFFGLLRETEAEQIWPGTSMFREKLEQFFAPADTTPGIRLDLMTIHNAKGLEWDTVIVPALGRPPQQEEKQLLYWRQRLRDRHDDLLLAPMQAPGAKDGISIESYLRHLLERRANEESKRLLYVAATRARRRLHLTATLAPDSTPRPRSLLSLLWKVPSVRMQFENLNTPPQEAYQEKPDRKVMIRRLPAHWKLPSSPEPLRWKHAPTPAITEERHTFEWASDARRVTGTVAHAFFQQIAREGLNEWDETRLHSMGHSVRASLLSAGIPRSELDGAEREVLRALSNTLSDERGRWILAAHEEATSELALTAIADECTHNIRIDRTFVEHGVRWIIDFKTTAIEGGSADAYLDQQADKYAPDLKRYRDAMQVLDPRPIKCALYFPLQKAWRVVIE